MKLLVFAHIPPPHHGQSFMIQQMLDALGGDIRQRTASAASDIECYHVNCRYSDSIEDIGSFRIGKVGLVLRYCAEAIWCRLRYGVRAFYYVPAPGKRAALYRDWLVMALCRPLFPYFIHHWHAVGLGDWLKNDARWWERAITHWLLGKARLGICLAPASMRDALWFRADEIELVPNGLPDPCPDFDQRVLPRRRGIGAPPMKTGDMSAPSIPPGSAEKYRLLFMSHCTEEKGLYDALHAFAAAAKRSAAPLHLDIAGEFGPNGRARFERTVAELSIADRITLHGFVSGEKKSALLTECDAFLFPSRHESYGLVVAEAMAHGLPLAATRVGAVPELLGWDYPGLVPPGDTAALAARIETLPLADEAVALRTRFLSHCTSAAHLTALRRALQTLETPTPSADRANN